MVKLNGSTVAIFMVIAMSIGAVTFRVTTAPERIRMRLDSAKASCLKAGGEWVKIDREESCLSAEDRKKS